MCKNKVIAVVIFFGICSKVKSQFAQTNTTNTIFVEFSSRKPFYSINYDRIFYAGDRVSYSYRAGIHILNDEIGIPLGISVLTGNGNKSHVEISLSVMPYVDRVNYLFREGNYSDKYIYITPGVGYRYQKPAGGLFLRALAAPQIVLDPRSDNFWAMDPKVFGVFSIGAGYSF